MSFPLACNTNPRPPIATIETNFISGASADLFDERTDLTFGSAALARDGFGLKRDFDSISWG
ncbi:MAG: hypothetical protein KF892_24045 [Rhizobacter sp.]|nr:hypothetical protein [Rhizobacter sp.]